jgi:hypothetical protein
MKKTVLTKKEERELSNYMKRNIKKQNEKAARDRAETFDNLKSALSNYKVSLARYQEMVSRCEEQIFLIEGNLRQYEK